MSNLFKKSIEYSIEIMSYMQDFQLENITKQTCSVIAMIHCQPVSVFTFAQYLAYLFVFVILKTARASSGRGP